MKLIVYNNKLGDIVRIGLYENDKWIKWLPKKELDKYAELCDEIENKKI